MASSSHPSATLLPTAPNSPGGLPSYMFEFDMSDSTVFDPQFELPESWGEVGQGEPGGYDDFNPLPPLSFPPLPFTLETEASSSNQFYPPTTLQPLPPAPPPDQLTTSLFSTFESSALSSFLTATLEGEPSPPPLPHHQPSTSSSSHSFKKSSESAFAGLVKARGAWDFNPVLPKGLPSWKKVGEGVQGVPSLSGLERMRIGEPSSSRGGRNPGDIGGQSGALFGWPSFAPSEYGSSSSSYRGGGGGGHTSINSTPLPNGRPSASFSSSSKRPPSTNRRRPSSSSSSRPQQQQQQQPPPPSSNTSGSTPSASTPTTLPDTDALMSEPTVSRAEEGLVDNSDEIMRGLVRVAGVDEDEGEEELDVDDDGEEISSRGSGTGGGSKGKGKRTARSAPTPTPPPSQRDDDFIPPSSSSSRTAAASRNRKRPKHDLAPPPTTSTSTRRTYSTSSSSASSSNNKLQTPSSPEDTPMQAVDHIPSHRAPSSVASSASAGGASSSNNGVGAVEVKQEQQLKGSFGRGLLTAKEKRENHILSEQKRRNAIRSSYAELSLILTSSTLSPLPLALPPSPPPSSNPAPGGAKKRGGGAKAAKAAGDVGVGRGGSKSSVLGKAVGLVRWLGEGNEWLEREVERLGGLVGEEGAGGVKMES